LDETNLLIYSIRDLVLQGAGNVFESLFTSSSMIVKEVNGAKSFRDQIFATVIAAGTYKKKVSYVYQQDKGGTKANRILYLLRDTRPPCIGLGMLSVRAPRRWFQE
jgi:hypothetical protein